MSRGHSTSRHLSPSIWATQNQKCQEKGGMKNPTLLLLIKKYDKNFKALEVPTAKAKATIFSFMEEDIVEPLD